MTTSPSNEASLVEENLALVVYQALQFTPLGILDLDDLISVGSIGLLKAVRGFDDGRGIQFSTYATTIIRNEIYRELKKFSKTKSIELSQEIEQEESPDIWEFMPEDLTKIERHVLYMRLVENRTFKEIGEEMDRTKSWASAKTKELLIKIREANGY
jgi:RNA polymerase sporulation-specific sigma factor